MNTHSPKRMNNYVGGQSSPTSRPRGGTLCVGVPKGGPPTTTTLRTRGVGGRRKQSPTSGGQHSSAVGDSTHNRNAALDWFTGEVEKALKNTEFVSPF